MRPRDPRHRHRRYDGHVRRQQFVRWTIGAVRLLAVPTALMSLLLGIDVLLPGPTEEGIAYRRSVDTRWVGADGYTVHVGWPDRPGCTEPRGEGPQELLFTTRPGCSGSLAVGAAFGRRLRGGDTLLVARTPMFDRVREIRHPADGLRDCFSSLLRIGLFVGLGLIPLLSFGENFAVHYGRKRPKRRLLAYVLPALIAEAVYVGVLLEAVAG